MRPRHRSSPGSRKLYVELDGVVDGAVTVAEEHELRRAMLERLDTLPYEIWLNVELVPRGATDHQES